MQFHWRQSRRLIERKPHLILQLGRVIILIALGHNPLLLLHRCYLTLDDGVQLSAHIVLDIHLMSHYFVRYCLLEFGCLYFGGGESFPCDDCAFPNENEME